jgi:hypothetical protein
MVAKRICLLWAVLLWHGVVFADGFDATVFQERYVTAMGSTKQDMLAAVDYLDNILEDDPQNPEALIYKGSILAKIASVDFWFWDKLAHVNEGIDLMTQGMELLDGKRCSGRTKISYVYKQGNNVRSNSRQF